MNTYGAFGSVTKERTEVVIDLSHFYIPFYTNLVGQFHVHRFFSFFHTGGVGGHHCLEPRGPSCEMGGVRVQMQTWQVDSNKINNINNIINNRNDINNINNIHYINIMNNNNNINNINNLNNINNINNINVNNINRLTRAPCFISPYHYRLDWLMWFAAFQKYQQNPWLVGILYIKTQFCFLSNQSPTIAMPC